jgi:hypothetical protein
MLRELMMSTFDSKKGAIEEKVTRQIVSRRSREIYSWKRQSEWAVKTLQPD